MKDASRSVAHPPSERTWSFAERLDAYEASGVITPPFSDAERATAHAASEAWFYAMYLTEMPARLHDDGVCCWLDWGITKVLQTRRGRA
jgi:hypothetical protein